MFVVRNNPHTEKKNAWLNFRNPLEGQACTIWPDFMHFVYKVKAVLK